MNLKTIIFFLIGIIFFEKNAILKADEFLDGDLEYYNLNNGVVVMGYQNNMNHIGCPATKIHKNFIIAAMHCVDSLTSNSRIFYSNKTFWDINNAQSMEVKRIYSFLTEAPVEGKLGGATYSDIPDDLALLEVSASDSLEWDTLATVSLGVLPQNPQSLPITVWGYGPTSEGAGDNARRVRTFNINKMNRNYHKLIITSPLLTFRGDSGGPVFYNNKMVGITTGGVLGSSDLYSLITNEVIAKINTIITNSLSSTSTPVNSSINSYPKYYPSTNPTINPTTNSTPPNSAFKSDKAQLAANKNPFSAIFVPGSNVCRITCDQNGPQSCALSSGMSQATCTQKQKEQICILQPNGSYDC